MEKNYVVKMISALNKLGLKYAFTGAFALAYYGFPRASGDVDVLVENNKTKLLRMCRLLRKEGFSIIERDVENAVKECGHFAVFYNTEPVYFDFKVICESFEVNAIRNVKTFRYHNVKCRIVSAENLIVKKLEWKDIKDVRFILFRYKDKIDMKKLFALANSRGVYEELKKLLAETNAGSP